MSVPVSNPYSQLVMQVLVERECVRRRILERCAIPEAGWDVGPLFWLTQHTRTEDTHAIQKGTDFRAPFPAKEYIRVLMDYMLWEQCRDPLASSTLFVLKTREMMFSWTVCGYIAWKCLFRNAFAISQSAKESKGAELVDYARILYSNQPEWMKQRNPLVVDNDLELKWKNGGRFMGVPSGPDQARMFHPSILFMDEAGFIPEAEQSFNAFRPVCSQVICGSTDEISWYSSECRAV